jgi:phosphotransferase system enzyme I (PtsI)
MSEHGGAMKSGFGVSPGICRGHAVVLGDEPTAEVRGQDCSPAEPVILVGYEFTGEDVLSMDTETVCGFVTATGGLTAPAGIVARAAGIPAVLGCSLLDHVKTGDTLIVDGRRGEVYINPSSAIIAKLKQLRLQYQVDQEELQDYRHLPAETADGWKVDVLANVDLADAIPGAIIGGASGIGLFRSEFYYLTGDGAPSEDFLFSIYQHVLSAVSPLPVTIRTLDLSGGAQVHGLNHGVEPNPALGLKGIRFSLVHPQVFKAQLRALYRASAFGKLRIVLPMMSSVDEWSLVKDMLAEVQKELDHEGIKVGDDVEIGLMIEVPVAAVMADLLAHDVDFFSIGINDLMQYTLAVDRVNAQVADRFESLDPGVLQIVKAIIQAGHDAGIDVGICGEMVGDPVYTPLLLGLGVDSLSMPVTSIASIKKILRASTLDDCCELAETLMQSSSAKASRRLLQAYLQEHHPDIIQDAV